MNLRELGLKEWLLLCGRAEETCVDRFRAAAERVADKDLKRILGDLVHEEEDHLEEIRRWDERTRWPIVCHVDEPAIDRLLRHHFPALFEGPAGGDREAIVRFAKSVEEESARFYRTLAVLASDPASERFFRKIARREERHLQVLSS